MLHDLVTHHWHLAQLLLNVFSASKAKTNEGIFLYKKKRKKAITHSSKWGFGRDGAPVSFCFRSCKSINGTHECRHTVFKCHFSCKLNTVISHALTSNCPKFWRLAVHNIKHCVCVCVCVCGGFGLELYEVLIVSVCGNGPAVLLSLLTCSSTFLPNVRDMRLCS